uniref:CSON004816 protein n=1 Tax=Culicoides sonorensis TaxID=179676 RepID=A0A336MRV2_CULSO
MPKNKKQESSDSDSGPEDRGPVKKQKTTGGNSNAGSGDPDVLCDLGRNRQVRLSEFKGRRYLDIREFYMDKSSSQMKPGKKGITLMLDEFNKLVENADAIRKAFSKG